MAATKARKVGRGGRQIVAVYLDAAEQDTARKSECDRQGQVDRCHDPLLSGCWDTWISLSIRFAGAQAPVSLGIARQPHKTRRVNACHLDARPEGPHALTRPWVPFDSARINTCASISLSSPFAVTTIGNAPGDPIIVLPGGPCRGPEYLQDLAELGKDHALVVLHPRPGSPIPPPMLRRQQPSMQSQRLSKRLRSCKGAILEAELVFLDDCRHYPWGGAAKCV